MSGAIFPTITHVGASPLYGSGGGGGGGGGSNFVVATVSTLNVSTIGTLPGNPVVEINSGFLYWSPDPVNEPNQGFEFYVGGGNTTNALADFDVLDGQASVGIRGYSTINGVQTIDSLALMNVNSDIFNLNYTLERGGVPFSTIMTLTADATQNPPLVSLSEKMNGATLLLQGGRVKVQPPNADLAHKKLGVQNGGNIYVPAAGTAQLLAGPFTTIAGHAYEVKFPNVRYGTSNGAVPDPLGFNSIFFDTSPQISYVDTKSLVEMSTFQTETSYTANFVASSNSHNIFAAGGLSGVAIGAITITNPALVFIRDLGAQSLMTAA